MSKENPAPSEPTTNIYRVSEDDKVVRRSFRVPVPKGLVTLYVGKGQFEVIDLSMSGVGIRIHDPEALTIGAVLSDAQIKFPDQKFHVDVKVIHISPKNPDELVCGLEIIKTHDSGYVDWVSRVIREIKSTVLSSLTTS